MKLLKSKLRVLALAAGSLAITVLSANAQNTNYAPGDLVLAFQEFGGSNTLYVGLGSATTYRGAASGADVANILNIININAELTAAFGAGWATNVNLYAGLSGVLSNSTGNTVTNGDPSRTLYVSKSRTAIGTLGTANSSGWSINTDGAMTTAANGMIAQNNILESTYTTQAAVSPTGTSGIDNANPFSGAVQGTAFGAFAGGVQQQGSASSFGTFGVVTNTEFALDLYRMVAKTGLAGQVAGNLRSGTYEGTITLDNSGNVSFQAIPEPSTYALMGLGALVIGYVVRRRRLQNL